VSTTACALSHRDLVMLRAVAAGGAQLLCGCLPDLLIDGGGAAASRRRTSWPLPSCWRPRWRRPRAPACQPS